MPESFFSRPGSRSCRSYRASKRTPAGLVVVETNLEKENPDNKHKLYLRVDASKPASMLLLPKMPLPPQVGGTDLDHLFENSAGLRPSSVVLEDALLEIDESIIEPASFMAPRLSVAGSELSALHFDPHENTNLDGHSND
ncbi:MAG: hypothetical protein Q8P67_19165, partial [archaeon]|nr:hypothetical protein [archaeon]